MCADSPRAGLCPAVACTGDECRTRDTCTRDGDCINPAHKCCTNAMASVCVDVIGVLAHFFPILLTNIAPIIFPVFTLVYFQIRVWL
jgi:hypothetical protein